MKTYVQPSTRGIRKSGRPPVSRRPLAQAGACAALLGLLAGSAHAQPAAGGMALNQLDPAPAGDPFFGVPSPFVKGHLLPRAYLMFDYAHRPMRFTPRSEPFYIVSSQAFLRLDASLALWERLLISVDLPVAVAQSGEQPPGVDIDFHPPSSAELGDLRVGLRARLFGEPDSPLQLGLEGNIYAPTAPALSYTGDGSARGAFHALAGGRLDLGIPLLWSLSAGGMLRTSTNPHTLTFGGGLAALFWKERLQIGAETFGSAWFGDRAPLSTPEVPLHSDNHVNLEVDLTSKVRIAQGFSAGAGVGTGLLRGIGEPPLRIMAMLSWEPNQAPPASASTTTATGPHGPDSDRDGFADDVDACPLIKGVLANDPAKDGCPLDDQDGDSVPDFEDSCPKLAGKPRAARSKNGCPDDTDGDGIYDPMDACVHTRGEPNKDRSKHGCPVEHELDELAPGREIALRKPIQFILYGKGRRETVEPVSDDVLRDVRDLLLSHPEILRIEVQGHTDDTGSEEFNQRLSTERAEAVRSWLVAVGVPPEKLVIRGYGFEAPVADNRVVTGRRKNRRVALVILETSR